jgi:NAD(P)-dependent dehydrogenase (short-subunit alcohol dehydrogenase family)
MVPGELSVTRCCFMKPLENKVCVITGANQGLGKGMARRFAQSGARLALCARNVLKLENFAAELRSNGTEVFAKPVDVAVEDQVDDFFDHVRAEWGRVDVLVNNAGAFDGGRVDTVSLEAWNNVIGACLTGAFLCTRRAFEVMREQGGGRILNIGSISAQRPRENSAPYSAAKFGVWGLTQATALDGRPYGITCSCLHPGNVLVERRQASGLTSDTEPMMTVETLAEVAHTMVTLPPEVNMLEAIVMPAQQLYLGRG